MAGWTNKGKFSALDAYMRNAGAPTNFNIALFTSATTPTADTNLVSDLTQIATGHGYADGHSHADGDAYRNRHPDGDPDGDAHSHTHCHADGHRHRHTHSR